MSIFLRAGWSLGAVTSRYIFAGQGSDQFVGRAACGLSLTGSKFASLPPHFLPDEASLNEKLYEEILPGFTDYPSCFKTVTPYLLASLVYHREILVGNLPRDHPIFNSRVWLLGIIEAMQGKVLAGCGKNSTSQMTATGIPPTLVIANEFEGLRETVITLANKVDSMQDRLEEQQKVNLSTIMGRLDLVPESVSDSIRSNLEINGVK